MINYMSDKKQVLFFCSRFLREASWKAARLSLEVKNRAYKDNFSVHRMQAAQLQHEEG